MKVNYKMNDTLLKNEKEDIYFESIEASISNILLELGENPNREGLIKTPERVAKSLKFLTGGYSEDINKIVNGAIFNEKNTEIVVVKDIDIFSTCEHHLLPIIGKAHVGYIPDGKVIGLSKIPRICDVFARRLQVQERLTEQIAETLQAILNPKGVVVMIDSAHMCMVMRGVQKQGSSTVTQAMKGIFKEDKKHLDEFYQYIKA
ncbi:MAG: GTP cyclohydrolase I FolE [Desulfobacteraceae bacterium]|nr:GTP cyclohydrolase I FolE [Desulfobacteraceae bacterium]